MCAAGADSDGGQVYWPCGCIPVGHQVSAARLPGRQPQAGDPVGGGFTPGGHYQAGQSCGSQGGYACDRTSRAGESRPPHCTLNHPCLQSRVTLPSSVWHSELLTRGRHRRELSFVACCQVGRFCSLQAAWHSLRSTDGVLVPGGFGSRGVEGMVLAAKFARESNTPYLGICLGMQVAVIEFARHVLEQVPPLAAPA